MVHNYHRFRMPNGLKNGHGSDGIKCTAAGIADHCDSSNAWIDAKDCVGI